MDGIFFVPTLCTDITGSSLQGATLWLTCSVPTPRILRNRHIQELVARMNTNKPTYADILKASSYSLLNPSFPIRPNESRAARVRLSEEAKKKLCATINPHPQPEFVQPTPIAPIESDNKKRGRLVKNPKAIPEVKKPSAPMIFTNWSQPLVLATASDWVMQGNVMRAAIYDLYKC